MLSVRNVKNIMCNRGRGNNNMPNILYHYCSLPVFNNIISSNILRLSNILKSNDGQERIFFAKAALEEMLKKKRHLTYTNEEVRWQMEKLLDEHTPYVACFSPDGDKLSQWRGYGDDGYGVSIGFATNILRDENLNNHGLKVKPVNYRSDDKLHGEVSDICELINFKELVTVLPEPKETYIYRKEEMDSLQETAGIVMNAVYYKSDYFREEQEYRIAINLPTVEKFIFGNHTLLCLLNEMQEKTDLRFFGPKLHLQHIGAVEYIELSFANERRLVKEIVIGPKAKISQDNIYNLLRCSGIESNNITVRKSRGSYR
jgi:hypothetical protein